LHVNTSENPENLISRLAPALPPIKIPLKYSKKDTKGTATKNTVQNVIKQQCECQAISDNNAIMPRHLAELIATTTDDLFRCLNAFNEWTCYHRDDRAQRVNPLKTEGILRKFQKVI
jgi:hypothetical protein